MLRLAAGAAAGLLLAPARPSRAEDDDGGSADFYSRWPYVVPSDILPFIRERAAPGDSDAVLAAMDEWAT